MLSPSAKNAATDGIMKKATRCMASFNRLQREAATVSTDPRWLAKTYAVAQADYFWQMQGGGISKGGISPAEANAIRPLRPSAAPGVE